MKKYKVYLDTSVINHLHQLDVPDKMAETKALWEKFKNDEFDIYLSDVTIDEVAGCDDEKKNILFGHLKEIKYTRLSISETSIALANQIIIQ